MVACDFVREREEKSDEAQKGRRKRGKLASERHVTAFMRLSGSLKQL